MSWNEPLITLQIWLRYGKPAGKPGTTPYRRR
jgi:hypothetical protein